MTTKKKWLFLLVVALVLSLAVSLALGGIAQFSLLHRLSVGAILLLTFLKLISWAFNALRTLFLMCLTGREVGFLEAAVITISAEFAGVTTPGAVGMAATYAFLFHRLGLRVGKAVGLVGLMIVTDLAVYSAIMPMAALMQILQGGLSYRELRMAVMSLVVVAGGIYFFWVLVRHHRLAYGFVGRQLLMIPWLAQRRWRMGRAVVDFLQAFRFLGRMSWPQRLALFLITLDFWLPRYLILLIVMDMVDQKVPAAYLLLAQAVLHMSGQASFIPGGAGMMEVGYATFMHPYMGAEIIAFTLLIWRFFTFYWYLLMGGPIFIYKAGRAAWDLLSKKSSALLKPPGASAAR